MGPLGFEPRTDGLKVSGSSFKTARKTHEKRTKLQVSAGNSRDKRRFQATSQIQNMTNMTRIRVETQLFLQSDRRFYFIKCPASGHEQKLTWEENVDLKTGDYIRK